MYGSRLNTMYLESYVGDSTKILFGVPNLFCPNSVPSGYWYSARSALFTYVVNGTLRGCEGAWCLNFSQIQWGDTYDTLVLQGSGQCGPEIGNYCKIIAHKKKARRTSTLTFIIRIKNIMKNGEFAPEEQIHHFYAPRICDSGSYSFFGI